MDGIYVAYVTGQHGTSAVMFTIDGNIFTGADEGGLVYDGQITLCDDGQYNVSVIYKVPKGAAIVTAPDPVIEEFEVPMNFKLPKEFFDGRIIRIDTPIGPINMIIKKLR